MTPTVQKTDSVQDAQLRELVIGELAERELSRAALARLLGIPKPQLEGWLDGDSEADGALIEHIVEWLDGAAGSDAIEGELLTGPQFCKLPTAERILNAFAYCHQYGDLGCVYGAAGVGKSRAIREYETKLKNVYVMCACPEIAGVHPMLEELSRAVGLRDCAGGSRTISRAIQSHLRTAKKPFLIIDEAQHLNLTALESLRSIHDSTEVGLMLVGNHLIYERLTGGTRVAHFAQLFSRMGMQVHVRRPVRQDVATLLEGWKLSDAKSCEYLMQIAKRPGALRGVTKVLRLAIAGAGGKVARVRLDHVRAAARNLGLEVVS